MHLTDFVHMFLGSLSGLLCILFLFQSLLQMHPRLRRPLVQFNPLIFILISSHLHLILLYSTDSIYSILFVLVLLPFCPLSQYNTKIGAASMLFFRCLFSFEHNNKIDIIYF